MSATRELREPSPPAPRRARVIIRPTAAPRKTLRVRVIRLEGEIKTQLSRATCFIISLELRHVSGGGKKKKTTPIIFLGKISTNRGTRLRGRQGQAAAFRFLVWSAKRLPSCPGPSRWGAQVSRGASHTLPCSGVGLLPSERPPLQEAAPQCPRRGGCTVGPSPGTRGAGDCPGVRSSPSLALSSWS